MSADRLVRERLRVERELIGTAHPFVALSYVVKKGHEVTAKAAARENPLTTPFVPPRLCP